MEIKHYVSTLLEHTVKATKLLHRGTLRAPMFQIKAALRQ